MTNLAKLTKAQLIAQIEDLRTKYSDLSIGYDQLRNDANQAQVEAMELSTLLDAETAAHRETSAQLVGITAVNELRHEEKWSETTDDEDDEDEYVDRRSIPVASRQDLASQRFETMQKAKALAMSSGRSVKC